MTEPRQLYRSPSAPALLETPIAQIKCLDCRMLLAPVFEHRGRTVLRFDHAYVTRAELVCPRCGAGRLFNSDPMSAVRLGISDLHKEETGDKLGR